MAHQTQCLRVCLLTAMFSSPYQKEMFCVRQEKVSLKFVGFSIRGFHNIWAKISLLKLNIQFFLKLNLPFFGFLKALSPFSSSLISSLKLYLPKRLMCSKDAGEIWSKSSSLTSYPSSLSSLTWRPRRFLEYKPCSKPSQYWLIMLGCKL